MAGRAKKRKNAGAGYGYMFHGAFNKKSDAEAKERKTKGAWIKGTLTNKGYRYMVMSPRTNPIKRKKRVTPEEARNWLLYDQPREWSNATGTKRKHLAKKTAMMRALARQANPHELLVMSANPSEIDDHNTQEISLPPGATIVIRTPRQNPVRPTANPDRFTSLHARAAGTQYQAPGLIRTAKQRRVAGLVRVTRARAGKHKYDWIDDLGPGGIAPGQNPIPDELTKLWHSARIAVGDSRHARLQWAAHEWAKVHPGEQVKAYKLLDRETRGYGQNPLGLSGALDLASIGTSLPGLLKGKRKRKNVELGTYENGVFHPWTRRPKSRQKKAIRRQNPDAAGIREDFTGMPVEWETTTTEPHMPAGDYAQLGELLVLYVKPNAGGQVREIQFNDPRPLLVSDETARQLYFVGGDQDLSDSLSTFGALDRGDGLFELGEARRIDYKQRKAHVKDPDVDEWRHELGEETGERPTVLFDSRHKRILFEGGAYEVRREGIVN